MPIFVEISDAEAAPELFDEVFSYFTYVDDKFSTYKDSSEISAINRGEIANDERSEDMKLVFALSEETKKLTNGYFDIVAQNGTYDPSGLVKGWAILNASRLLKNHGIKNFYIEAGGDIQTSGHNANGLPWHIGIQNPFANKKEIVKVVHLKNNGIATSGTYRRGQHIYNPMKKNSTIDDVISMTVVGPDIYEADRFATAAFAMGQKGIEFIERLVGFEGYQIDRNGIATMTSGFNQYANESYA